MKPIPTLAAAALALALSLPAPLHAQETLKALIKQCETMNNVNVNTVSRKDKKTGQLEPSVITITINDNPTLCRRFTDAFNKDRTAAEQEIINRSDGRINTLTYRFADATYTYTPYGQADKGNAVVSVVRRGVHQFNFDFNFDSLNERLNERLKDLPERLNDASRRIEERLKELPSDISIDISTPQ
jgi:hypothetical protein